MHCNCCSKDRSHDSSRYSERVVTPHSHFEIPSFAYLGVTQFKPVIHASGLQLASVATMALSNLLHHPQIVRPCRN